MIERSGRADQTAISVNLSPTVLEVGRGLATPVVLAVMAQYVAVSGQELSAFIGVAVSYSVADCILVSSGEYETQAVLGSVIRRMLLLTVILGVVYAIFAPGHPLEWIPVFASITLLALACFGSSLLVSKRASNRLEGSLFIAPALIWFLPILYDPEGIPRAIGAFLRLNPLYPYFSAIRAAVVFGSAPKAGLWIWMTLWGVGLAITGLKMDALRHVRSRSHSPSKTDEPPC